METHGAYKEVVWREKPTEAKVCYVTTTVNNSITIVVVAAEH